MPFALSSGTTLNQLFLWPGINWETGNSTGKTHVGEDISICSQICGNSRHDWLLLINILQGAYYQQVREHWGKAEAIPFLLKGVSSSTAQGLVRAQQGCLWKLGWLLLWLLLCWYLARPPVSHVAGWCYCWPTTSTTIDSSWIHHCLQISWKAQNTLDFKRLSRRKNLSGFSLGLVWPDWLHESQPLRTQKYATLTAAIEPNP